MKAFPLFLFSLLLFTLACSGDKSDYDQKYETTLLLAYATTSADANGACVSLSQKQETCVSAPAVALGFSVTATSNDILVARCTDTLKTSQYNKMSAMAQTCVINCQVTDWTTKISSGECKTGTASSLLQSSLTNTVVSKCIRNCFSTTNGLVSDEDITKLYILNLIQQGD